ncbi:A24 family peptidase [Roseibium marinum]|uniref:Prepilin peptidase CpaA n=1 Tax=Roseibium marinum TaxID=281252 RepID=A0A2S3V381_9HYPH|nr:prepilin peptidase [Roseibium marinum]POF34442.1 prepilin peptidase CpaA [Roseibium marinum]
MIEAAILVIFPMLVAFGGASDLLTMTIRNRVSILLIAGFAGLALATGLPLSDWGMHALGLLVVFPVCFGFFSAGWMGGGDVKFISAIALWIGLTPELGAFVILVSIYGMVLTFGLLFLRKIEVVPVALATQDWFARLHDRRGGIPYGIAIAAAGLKIYPSTEWFQLAARGL